MENDILKNYIKENILRVQYENIPAAVSKFLDSAALSCAAEIKNKMQGNFLFWGGFEGAERVIMLCIPDYLGADITPSEIFPLYADCPICALRVIKDKFTTLSHRDYLGALMGLGLERNTIGDISLRDDGCDIIALPTAAKYINNNLTSVGRASVKTQIINIKDVIPPKIEVQNITFTVASPRLDAVLGDIFNLSRSSSCDAISQGLIYLNDLQVQKPDKKVNPNDKIVMRGKGKVVIGDEFIKTKKGRIRIEAKKYI